MIMWQARLDAVLRSWQMTPWSAGQACKGRGVDCRYFVLCVMDELHGVTAPLPPRLPQDTSKNNRPLAIAAVRQISTRYPCRVLASDESIEPGDVLVVRRPNAHQETLQHVMIAGIGSPMQIWHAGEGGVCFTSMHGWTVQRVFRSTEKERWSR